MSFNPKSLERLRQLGRELPKELPSPDKSPPQNNDTKAKQHPIEAEKNPHKLFRELIKASSDGNVPKHLLSRLKQLEEKEIQISNSSQPINSNIQNENLYVSFTQLLLEEEEMSN